MMSSSANKKIKTDPNSFYEQIDQVQFPAPLPSTLFRVKQNFDAPKIQNVSNATSEELLTSGLLKSIQTNDTVAVGVGSRGISNLVDIVATTVEVLKQHGAKPFLFPAMGSHGGATAEGQTKILNDLGITQESTGAEIRATMQVIEIGQVFEKKDPIVIYQDLFASQADHVLLINRIKAHTSFRSNIESGLAKMAVIGMGKQKGAAAMHARGVVGLQTCLGPAARLYEAQSNLRGGLAIVENARDETADVVALHACDVGNEKEAQLLLKSKSLMAKLPFDQIDVLVVFQLGKKISGTGMDTNVIRRFKIPRQAEPTVGPDIATICVLDVVTTETSLFGNSNGMGLANVISSRLHKKIDWKATYTNALTSGVLGMWKASMPITMVDDCRTIQAAVLGCGEPPDDARIVFIKNTLELEELWASPNLRQEIEANDKLSIVQDNVPLLFDDKGIMQSPWKLSPP